MPKINLHKRLHEVLDGLEGLKARVETLETELGKIAEDIDVQWEEISELLPGPDDPDPETGQTKEQLAEMGWPLTGEPVEDTVEPKPV